MNIWHDVDPETIKPEDFDAAIEIPKGSNCKYELDKKGGFRRLDRVLYTATHYPANYGFIPRTYADDGDPLDVLVLCSEAIYPMTLVRCYPIGAMRMIDSGKLDDKIIVTRPMRELPLFMNYRTIFSMKSGTSLWCISNWSISRLRSRSFSIRQRQSRLLPMRLKHTDSCGENNGFISGKEAPACIVFWLLKMMRELRMRSQHRQKCGSLKHVV